VRQKKEVMWNKKVGIFLADNSLRLLVSMPLRDFSFCFTFSCDTVKNNNSNSNNNYNSLLLL
jgi:hypothetical protein